MRGEGEGVGEGEGEGEGEALRRGKERPSFPLTARLRREARARR